MLGFCVCMVNSGWLVLMWLCLCICRVSLVSGVEGVLVSFVMCDRCWLLIVVIMLLCGVSIGCCYGVLLGMCSLFWVV